MRANIETVLETVSDGRSVSECKETVKLQDEHIINLWQSAKCKQQHRPINVGLSFMFFMVVLILMFVISIFGQHKTI